ncbi:MAG: carbon-nitrogen hydrolase family protein [Alphaproteobacteria bacterium]|nr:carbon-nitrogen hydrolase family protein [Alphaproteobacteria bacterium]
MSVSVTVSCVQLNSSEHIEENLEQAAVHIREAAAAGAEFITTPENTDFIRKTPELTLETAPLVGEHPGLPAFSFLAKELSVWILVGSMKVKLDNGKLANRSFLFSDTGQLMASYDKMHLFDVDLPNGESHQESAIMQPGEKAVVVNTPWKKLGLSICYDIRFPYLFRDLAKNGAEMIALPSAFTVPTGRDHWETLLRARAIETGSFIIAPAQCGIHEGGRETYGHSMIVGPWGQVLAEKTERSSGYILRKISFLDVTKARAAIPSLQHGRSYEFYKSKDLN